MPDKDADLYLMVGEIRSDVKTLLKSVAVDDARLRKVEHRQWWLAGVIAAVAVFAAKIGLPDFTQVVPH